MGQREFLHRVRADTRAVPWKNGRGVTEELALWPSGSSLERGDFGWRISKAAVDEPGPFSSFPGVERILVVTAGRALVLDHGDAAPRVRLRPLEPYRFSGDWPTRAELPLGPVSDCNVMLRRDAASAEVEALRLGQRRVREPLGRGHAFVHVLAGSARARATGEDEPFELAAEESLWARGLDGSEELELTGSSAACTLLLVRIELSEDRAG